MNSEPLDQNMVGMLADLLAKVIIMMREADRIPHCNMLYRSSNMQRSIHQNYYSEYYDVTSGLTNDKIQALV